MVQREPLDPMMSLRPKDHLSANQRVATAPTGSELAAAHLLPCTALASDVQDKGCVTHISGLPVRAASSDCRLLVRLDGVEGGRVLSLGNAPISVGRGQDNRLRVDDTSVSRRHAVIAWDDGFHLVADLGSSNGTYLGGRRVALATLVDGDLLQFGPRARFRYTVTDAGHEKLMRQLYESSIVDALTGIYNRRHFDARLRAEMSYAHRHGTDLAVVLLDIDFFKAVNDTHGHAAGDTVLKHVSTLAAAQLRAEDVVARYGGEEFVMLLRETDVCGAVRLAERVRATIDVMPAGVAGKLVPVSISAGCASLRESEGDRAAELIARADERLYAAKRTGRNRVVGAHAPHDNP